MNIIFHHYFSGRGKCRFGRQELYKNDGTIRIEQYYYLNFCKILRRPCFNYTSLSIIVKDGEQQGVRLPIGIRAPTGRDLFAKIMAIKYNGYMPRLEEKLNILGINISTLNRQKILQKIDAFLASAKPNFLVTVNPEIILQAMEDEEYFAMINNADLAVPDGAGLTFAAWALFTRVYRWPGVDLTDVLLSKAAQENIKVAILLWNGGLTHARNINEVFKNKYPQLNFICREIDKEVDAKLDSDIDGFAPQLVLVSLGSPWQEKIIWHQLLKKDYVRLAIGVGGTFDFICGKIARAPKWMRTFGLEWVWRLIQQPWRWRRIYNALIVFTAKYLKWLLILPLLYRPNVACLLYKKENDKYKILIVKRSDTEDEHWQLPQGGLDGLDIISAGKKEIVEEIGIKNIRTVAVFKNLYKYQFDNKIRTKFNYNNLPQRNNGYKGQRQSLYIAEFLGQDSDIRINYWDHSGWQWVDAYNFLNEVHPVRREGYRIYLKKFKEVVK